MWDNTVLSNQGTYQFTADSNVLFGTSPPTRSSTRPREQSRKSPEPARRPSGFLSTIRAAPWTPVRDPQAYRRRHEYRRHLYRQRHGGCGFDRGHHPHVPGTYTGSGRGRVQLVSGTLNIGGSGATLNFPTGLLVCSAARPQRHADQATAGVITSERPLGGTVDNLGTITQTGGNVNLVNNGTFTVNSGTMNLSGGTGGTLTRLLPPSTSGVELRRSDHVTGSGGVNT